MTPSNGIPLSTVQSCIRIQGHYKYLSAGSDLYPDTIAKYPGRNSCLVKSNTQKSIDSNDTGHSDSTTVVQTTTGDKESNMRENGNGNMNHVHGTGNGTLGTADGANNIEPRSLNLTMSAKELREMLAQRKKYDPKKESIGFKDKFDIVQKL
ncbi:hypothetical protein ALC57_09856 [Trachymyrmex cornetzi]|uniref:Uncharacterized protein n=1 Tax=Trachymyrmex cornetzi TaxID=471704 RepID=A0A151J511_9HYME|nr:hypothetical protein ALC57_09856 [Trachymyrmex cornetzi]